MSKPEMLNKTEGSLLYGWTDETTYHEVTTDLVKQCMQKSDIETDMCALCPLSVWE